MKLGAPEVTVAIPARLESRRFPNKLLAQVKGTPLIAHVIRAAREAVGDPPVLVTDSSKLGQIAEAEGASVLWSEGSFESGTERIQSVIERIPSSLIVNVQGDDPTLPPELIRQTIHELVGDPQTVVTPKYAIDESRRANPSSVKVVCDMNGNALYFSRSPIPHLSSHGGTVSEDSHLSQSPRMWGHVGVYGYSRDLLNWYVKRLRGPLESAENLEQLRFLEGGVTIRTFETEFVPRAVDTPEDLKRLS